MSNGRGRTRAASFANASSSSSSPFAYTPRRGRSPRPPPPPAPAAAAKHPCPAATPGSSIGSRHGAARARTPRRRDGVRLRVPHGDVEPVARVATRARRHPRQTFDPPPSIATAPAARRAGRSVRAHRLQRARRVERDGQNGTRLETARRHDRRVCECRCRVRQTATTSGARVFQRVRRTRRSRRFRRFFP